MQTIDTVPKDGRTVIFVGVYPDGFVYNHPFTFRDGTFVDPIGFIDADTFNVNWTHWYEQQVPVV